MNPQPTPTELEAIDRLCAEIRAAIDILDSCGLTAPAPGVPESVISVACLWSDTPFAGGSR